MTKTLTKTETKSEALKAFELIYARLEEMAKTFPEKADPELLPDGTPIPEVELEKQERTHEATLAVVDYEMFKLPPDEFIEARNVNGEVLSEMRQKEVYADSIENACGYDALSRVLKEHMSEWIAYYRSEKGGALSIEEARAKVFTKPLNDEEIKERLNDLLTKPIHWIRFDELYEMNRDAPVVAQNLWEAIKQDARLEFESGHLAANALQPMEKLRDAWTRARYLGVRESFITEYKAVGGIELAMIDTMTQSWLALQFWTEESFRRSQLEPRREPYEYQRWKEQERIDRKVHHDPPGHWDVPYVSEQTAIEHAAQMADRFQRMFFRAVRQLRDWHKYSPPVTINNPQQVNIGEQVNVANENGQQVNVSTKHK